MDVLTCEYCRRDYEIEPGKATHPPVAFCPDSNQVVRIYSMKEPNAIEAISQDRIGPVTNGARRFMKRMRARLLRRYAKRDVDNLRPKARHRGWYW